MNFCYSYNNSKTDSNFSLLEKVPQNSSVSLNITYLGSWILEFFSSKFDKYIIKIW